MDDDQNQDQDGAFWEITSAIDGDDPRARARDELAGDRSSFADLLRDIPAGEVVTLVTLDGADLRGRVLHVGSDVVRLGEVGGGGGVRGRRIVRCHDVRLAAVARLVWEPAA